MKKLKLTLFFLFLATCGFSQIEEKDFVQKTTYKISNEVAEQLFIQKKLKKSEVLDVLSTKDTVSLDENLLPPVGHYITVKRWSDFEIDYDNYSEIKVDATNNRQDVLLVVRDYLGNFLQEGVFVLNEKEYTYNEDYDAFIIPMKDFGKESKFFFRYKGHSKFYRSSLDKGKTKIREVFTFKKDYLIDEENDYNKAPRCFIIINKKSLKHGDTLSFKVFVESLKFKPLRKGIIVTIGKSRYSKGEEVKIKKITDRHYEGEFYCNDSLYTGTYILQVRKNNKKYQSRIEEQEFKIGPYKLEKYLLEFKSQRIGKTDSILVNHYLTDVNHRPIKNYDIHLSAKISTLDKFQGTTINHNLLDTSYIVTNDFFGFSNEQLLRFNGELSIQYEITTQDGTFFKSSNELEINNLMETHEKWKLIELGENKYLVEGTEKEAICNLTKRQYGGRWDTYHTLKVKNGDTIFVSPLAKYYSIRTFTRSSYKYNSGPLKRSNVNELNASSHISTEEIEINANSGYNKHHLAIMSEDSILYAGISNQQTMKVPLDVQKTKINFWGDEEVQYESIKKNFNDLDVQIQTKTQVKPNSEEVLCVQVKDENNNPLSGAIVDLKVINSQLPEQQEIDFSGTEKYRKTKARYDFQDIESSNYWKKNLKPDELEKYFISDSNNWVHRFLDSKKDYDIISYGWEEGKTVIQPIVLEDQEKVRIKYIIVNGRLHFWDRIQDDELDYVLGVRDSASIYIRTKNHLHEIPKIKIENGKINYLLVNEDLMDSPKRKFKLKKRETSFLEKNTLTFYRKDLSYIEIGDYIHNVDQSTYKKTVSFPKSFSDYKLYDLEGNQIKLNTNDLKPRYSSLEKDYSSLDTLVYIQEYTGDIDNIYTKLQERASGYKYGLKDLFFNNSYDLVLLKPLTAKTEKFILSTKSAIPLYKEGSYEEYAFKERKGLYYVDSLEYEYNNDISTNIEFDWKAISEEKLFELLKQLNNESEVNKAEASFNLPDGNLVIFSKKTLLETEISAKFYDTNGDTLTPKIISFYYSNDRLSRCKLRLNEQVYSYSSYNSKLREIGYYSSEDPFNTKKTSYDRRYRRHHFLRKVGRVFTFRRKHYYYHSPRDRFGGHVRYGNLSKLRNTSSVTLPGLSYSNEYASSSGNSREEAVYSLNSVAISSQMRKRGSVLMSNSNKLAYNDPIPDTYESINDYSIGDAGYLRGAFNDQALFKTTQIANDSGKVCVTINYPGNITTWKLKTYVVADEGRFKKEETMIECVLNQTIQSVVPEYLVEGDQVSIPVFAFNSDTTKLNVEVKLKTLGKTQDKRIQLDDFSSMFFPVQANENDFTIQTYASFSNGSHDGEARDVAVQTKSLVRTHRIALGNQADTTITLPKDATIIKVNGVHELLTHLGDQFKSYKYHCNEQEASMLVLESINTQKSPRKRLNKIRLSRNSDYLWGWSKYSPTDQYLSVHVLNCLEAYDSLFNRDYTNQVFSYGLKKGLKRHVGEFPLLWLKAYELDIKLDELNEHIQRMNRSDFTLLTKEELMAHKKLCKLVGAKSPLNYDDLMLSRETARWNNKWLKKWLFDEKIDFVEVVGYLKEHQRFTTYSASQVACGVIHEGYRLPKANESKKHEYHKTTSDTLLTFNNTNDLSCYLITYQDTIKDPEVKKSQNLSVSLSIEDTLKFGGQHHLKVNIENSDSLQYLMVEIPLVAGLNPLSTYYKNRNGYLIDVREDKILIYLEDFTTGVIEIPVKTSFKGKFTQKTPFIFDMYGQSNYAHGANRKLIID